MVGHGPETKNSNYILVTMQIVIQIPDPVIL